MELVKCGIYLTINAHRDYYQSVTDYLADQHPDATDDPDVIARMTKMGVVVELQCYPNTPIASYTVLDTDVDAATARMLAILSA
jgi:hypothetical protein